MLMKLLFLLVLVGGLCLGCAGDNIQGHNGNGSVDGLSRADQAHCYSPLVISANTPITIDGKSVGNRYIDNSPVPRQGLYYLGIYPGNDIVKVTIRLNGSYESVNEFCGRPVMVIEGPYTFVIYDAGASRLMP
jgi:hypothetical protein